MTPIFPAGAAGSGLLFLRVSVAISLLALAGTLTTPGDWRHTAAILAAIALFLGLQTRVIAIASLSAPLLSLNSGGEPAMIAVHVASSIALSLIGAGAFSVDAHFFGRRKISLSKRRPPPG